MTPAQVNDAQVIGQDHRRHLLNGIGSATAQVDHIDIAKRSFGLNHEVTLTHNAVNEGIQSLTSLAGIHHPPQFHVGMVDEQAHQLRCPMVITPDDTNLNHQRRDFALA